MRSRHCRVCGEWHDLGVAWPNACIGHFGTFGPRSSLAAPMLIRDGIDPFTSMADGRTYDSKRAYYASVREKGLEIVGNERAAFDAPRPEFKVEGVGEAIKHAIEQSEAA